MTLGNFAGIGAVNDETASLAGYMIASIPFLAAGMARGAMAIAGHATSFLAPSQNAAEAAAGEATTGNYAYGNASLANQNINTQASNQWNNQPNFASGSPAFAHRQANGVMSTTHADGSTVTNQNPAISSFEWKPTLTQANVGEMRSTVGEFQNQATQQREMASQSLSAANTIGAQLFTTAQNSRGSETILGQQTQDAISQAQNLTRSWSDTLVNDYGFDRKAADELSRFSYMQGSGNLGVSSPVPGLDAGINASVLSQESRNRTSGGSVNERIAKGLSFLNLNDRQRQTRNVLEERFRSSFVEDMRNDLGPIGPMPSSGIAQPAGDVKEWGSGQVGVVTNSGPAVDVRSDSRDVGLTSLVGERIEGANERMDAHQFDTNFSNGDLHRRGEAMFTGSANAQNLSIGETMPIVGPLFERDNSSNGPGNASSFNATGYIRDKGMSIKPGTDVTTLDSRMAPAISAVAQETQRLGLSPRTVTSAQDRIHKPGSLHPDGKALDFRGNNITITQGRALARVVRARLGPDYDVAFETSRNDPDNNHLHAEYDPKRGRRK